MRQNKIRILVVDDSALMRKKISDMINSDEDCEVIATARNGEEGVKKVLDLHPHVVTLDIELPKMDGIAALKTIMSQYPTPVIMVSALSRYNGEKTIKSLEYGAVDVVAKPSGVISLDIEKLRNDLIAKVKIAAQANLQTLKLLRIERRPGKKLAKMVSTSKIVTIASSTGGPRALVEVLPRLAAGIRAGILVIQHIPEGFTRSMAERLNAESKIRVKEAEEGEPIREGQALIAPGGFHLTVVRRDKNEVVRLIKPSTNHGICPSADMAMKSAAALYGKKALGVVLTGMGSDGTEGLRAIKQYGGYTLAEDKSTSIVYGMPKAAYEAGVVDQVIPLPQLAGEMMRWAGL